MWDTGAPHLHRLGNYLNRPADPFNPWEPVDTSAAAIAAQGLVRLGNYLSARGDSRNGPHYRQAGLTVAGTLFDEPYLSADPRHQGLLLHSVYHRPNGWDYVAARAESAERRKLDVGRLPCARTGAAAPARGTAREVSGVLCRAGLTFFWTAAASEARRRFG